MREHSGSIEASLRFHCAGLSLSELGTESLTWPDFAAILAWLPSTSPYKRETEPEWVGWDVNAQQLAALIDHAAAANWQRGNAGAKKSDRTPFPDPTWRPYQVVEQRERDRVMRLREKNHRENLRQRGGV